VSDDAMACAPVHVSDPPVWQRLGLGVLAEHVPIDLIDDGLTRTGRVQQRVRRLPARVTVLFALALSLFSGMGYRAVSVSARRKNRRAASAPRRAETSGVETLSGCGPVKAVKAIHGCTRAEELARPAGQPSPKRQPAFSASAAPRETAAWVPVIRADLCN
jgi:hypothetical protein